MSRKGNTKALCVFLTLLFLFLVGTVVVLSTVVHYFGVDWHDMITEQEMAKFERLAAQASAQANQITNLNLDNPDQRGSSSTSSPVESEDGDDESVGQSIHEVDLLAGLDERGLSDLTEQPRIPKIIHQTWINGTLPAEWQPARESCALLHPS